MTGGEALINQWHKRVLNRGSQGSKQGSRLSLGGHPITPAQSLDRPRRSHQPSGGAAESAKFWTAFLELIDVNAQVALAC